MSIGSVVNNLNANQAIYSLNVNQYAQTALFNQASSGLKDNSPADNPAQYTIATNQQTAINASDEANANIQNYSNAAGVASDALNSINANLAAIGNLAISANSSFVSAADGAAIQSQVDQLVAQINSTAANTQFNGVSLLDGSFSNASIQTGPNIGNDTVTSIPNVSATALGVAGLNVLTSNASNVQGLITGAIGIVGAAQANLGTSVSALNDQAQNNAITALNLQASKTNLTDLNYGSASTQIADNQLLTQFGTALLAQANVNQYSVLKLVTKRISGS